MATDIEARLQGGRSFSPLSPSEVEEPEIDLSDLLVRLLAKRWWIIVAVCFAGAMSAALAFLMEPVYRASVVVVPAGNERSAISSALGSAMGSLGGLASIAGVNLGGSGGETEEALAVLKSREFTERFIADKQLMPVLFADDWDPARNEWTVPEKSRPTPADAYKYFDTEIRRIVQEKKTGLITLHIDWRDRQQAAEWANELIERANEEMRLRAIGKANASIGYLENELQATTFVEMREAINRLMEAQIKQRMLASVSHEYVFRVVDRAMPPDKKDRLRPNRKLIMSVGTIAGFLFGVGGVLFYEWITALTRSVRERRAHSAP